MTLKTDLKEDGTFVVSISGDFNYLMASDFRRMYKDDNDLTGKKIIFDLSLAETLDSSALGMLLGMQKDLGIADKEMVIINANKFVRNIFKMTNLQNKFEIK